MAKVLSALENNIRENVRNYALGNLIGEKQLEMFFENFGEYSGLSVLLTDRYGVAVASYGNLSPAQLDPEKEPGRRITIQGRTMGHFYARKADVEMTLQEEAFLDSLVHMIERLATLSYMQRETALYIDMKENSATPGMKFRNVDKEDGLTGLFNKDYFESRMKILDRAQAVPVAAILANVNDWKYVNDNYGDDESDRLIQIIGHILKQEAKEEYLVGRTKGDDFQILIPLAEEGEAEEYIARVQAACLAYEDERLAPSVAIGLQYKTNIEETCAQKLEDAEFEMLENKLEIKSAPGYRERLEKGRK